MGDDMNNKLISKVLVLSVLFNICLSGFAGYLMLRSPTVVYVSPSNQDTVNRNLNNPSFGVKLILQHYRGGSLIGTYIYNDDLVLSNMAFMYSYLFKGSGTAFGVRDESGTSLSITFINSDHSRIESGSGTTSVQCNDYNLNALVSSNTISSIATNNSTQVCTMSSVLSYGSSNSITEFGLSFLNNYGGTYILCCRDVVSPISVNGGDTITATYEFDWNA
jgi:hypothetical protein